MSNSPNMSYCMYQNTSLALHQILTAIDEEGLESHFLDLSREEYQAFMHLAALCGDFVKMYEEVYEEKLDEQYAKARGW